MTAAEYLRIERAAETKSEFWDGQMWAMAGGTRFHSIIKVNVASELRGKLKEGSCQVFDSDMRVKIEMADAYAYPDVSVACGEQQFENETCDVLLNPTVIVEVLSSASEVYDRTSKFDLYRRIPSLQEYILVKQDKPHIGQYIRQADGGWLLRDVDGLDASLILPSVQIEVAMREIFSKVKFELVERGRK